MDFLSIRLNVNVCEARGQRQPGKQPVSTAWATTMGRCWRWPVLVHSGCASCDSMVATRVVVLWWTLVVVVAQPILACSLGGSIVNRVECDLAGSPYTVTQDVDVLKGATLVLRPGVTLQFDPGVGITVRGILEAEVRIQAAAPPATMYLECGDLNLPRRDGWAHLQLRLPSPCPDLPSFNFDHLFIHILHESVSEWRWWRGRRNGKAGGKVLSGARWKFLKMAKVAASRVTSFWRSVYMTAAVPPTSPAVFRRPV